MNWDSKAARYRGSSGRFIARGTVVDALERGREEAQKRVTRLAEDLQSKKINLAQWTLDMRAQVKTMHLLSAGIAYGGKAQLSPARLGKIGSQVKTQYQFLDRFSRQIMSGEQKLDGRFLTRASMYVSASRGTFYETEKGMQRERGVERARRVLNARESCAGCIDEAARGLVEIEDLAEIGSQECKTNCLCSVEYETAA